MKHISDVIAREIKGIWGEDPEGKQPLTLVIKTNNMSYEGMINYEDISLRYIPIEKLPGFYLQTGDLLIEKSGGTKTHSVGYVNYFDGKNNKYVCNNFILVLRPNSKLIESKYLFYQLKYKYESGKFSDCYNKTTGIQNLQTKAYLSKSVKVPDFDDQAQCIKDLDHIQQGICFKQNQIKALDSLVKSRFMEMFGEWNLSFQKENWIKLSDLTNIYTGTTPKTEIEEYWNGLIPWVTPAELDKDSYLITDTERHITEKGQKSKSLTMMPIGTVLLSTRAPIGKVAICGVPMTCNQGFKNFECLEKLHPTYLFYLLKLNNDWLQTQGTGTTFKEISKSKAGNIRIPVPTMSDQKDFAQFYNLVDKSRFVVQKEIKDLQELLDSKMDEYFGGEE